MPLDIGECVNKAAESVLKAPFMRAVASNPIYTAMIIVFVVMLVVLIVFRDTKSEDSILVMTLRSGFWIFLSTLGIIFMHNKVLTADEEIKGYDGLFEESVERVDTVPIAIPGAVPPRPALTQIPTFDVSKLAPSIQPAAQQTQPVVSPVSVTISVPSVGSPSVGTSSIGLQRQ